MASLMSLAHWILWVQDLEVKNSKVRWKETNLDFLKVDLMVTNLETQMVN